MDARVPDFLAQRLIAQYGAQTAERIAVGYACRRAQTLRVNRLKAEPAVVRRALEESGIQVRGVPWSEDALIADDTQAGVLAALPIYERGEIYLQSLSSMLPPLFLGALPEENVLDMAAAPGGKTTQIAALTNNRAMITACEMHAIRAERLRYNVQRQGASRVTVMQTDARKLDAMFSFDRILLDAPCSGSGTLQLNDTHLRAQFGARHLEKTTRAQEALLLKALSLLRPGCEMIYSTCSVLAEENEDRVRRVLDRGAELVELDLSALDGVPRLPTALPGTLCVCPDALYEGFFVAKLRRKR